MSGRGPATERGEPGRVAAPEVIARIGWMAVAYGVGLLATAALRGAWGAALVLTLSVGVSIVGFRSLVGAVSRLDADAGGNMARGGGWRFALRWSLLTAALAAVIILGSREILALILGFTVVPLALITEGGLQLASSGRGHAR